MTAAAKPFSSRDEAYDWVCEKGIGNHVDLETLDGGWIRAYALTDDGQRVEFQHAPDWGDWVFWDTIDALIEVSS